MLHQNFRLINEEFHAEAVLPEQMDSLWAMGWRHFGTHFFRYNVGFLHLDIQFVLPLRIRLSELRFSKSQRRVLRRNEDLRVEIGPATITDADHAMFLRHTTRFNHSIPESLFNFIAPVPSAGPCETKEIRVFDRETLVALSYFDVGRNATSGVYGMFEPAVTERSLGIFTMLKEIEYAIETGREFYYLGYAYEGPSFYDYKKQFRGTEAFDWDDEWRSLDEYSPFTA
jgi:arginine-tRNA-protein transferase